MKRYLGIVDYHTNTNSNGWRTKYFGPQIVECDIEAELNEDESNGVSNPTRKSVLAWLRVNVEIGAWKHIVVEEMNAKNKAPNRETPEDWLLRKSIEYDVFNLEGVNALYKTGSIMNVLEPEYQMAYQFR